ncbi:sugar phosphate isomerase/epimerase family protein [Deinococcus pimensis]|uniref:sugar phosphate isomerase/epimerase family protein n=1 Tax=Deinococcus pimensis TaxID=309888 RepID=UPI0004B568E2|nr:sugar phosphate isomerase/epimerase family protein [Deinococcus pimensis]
MVRFGAHAFVWTGEWTRESGNAAIRAASDAGFDFIEIPLLDPDDFDAASHRAALAETGLAATCSLTLPPDAHLPHRPEAARAFLTRVLDRMEALGSTYLAGCVGYSLGTLTGRPPEPWERERVAEVLGTVARDAGARGITLALEACNRYETYLYNTLADTRDTVLRVGEPNVRLHADTYHMNIEEEGFRAPLVAAADVLDYVHMSESHRGLVGTGTVIWDDVWSGLREARFRGALVLESFAAINPALAAATCLWRPTRHPPEVLAREGLAFLRDGAARFGLLQSAETAMD